MVVVVTIISIIGTIGFYSYTSNISTAQDTVRETDISALRSELSLYKRERWAYPFPGDHFSITNRGLEVAYQWYMNRNVALSTAEKLPYDPLLNIPYVYSTTVNRQEYELAATLENKGSQKALVWWDYKSVAKNVLPHIILAYNSQTDMEISNDFSAGSTNRKLFVFDEWTHNLVYDIYTGNPYSSGVSFDTNLNDGSESFWQNSDYRDCDEIASARKNITPTWSQDQYQILNDSWTLVNTSCSWVN